MLRVMTRREWLSRFQILSFNAYNRPARQAEVGWEFTIRDLKSMRNSTISGHVQIRWSHGKNFTKNCESKVYLDSGHNRILAMTRSDARAFCCQFYKFA